jgi:uncharacterized membrane protein YwaF
VSCSPLDLHGISCGGVPGYIIFAVGAVVAAVLISYWLYRRRREQKVTGGRRW